MIVPGAGQAFTGAWRRDLVLFALFAFAAVPVLVAAAVPVRAAAWLLEGRLLPAALAVNIFLLALRLFAALDAWRMGVLAKSVPALAAGAIAVLTMTPHVAAGYVTVRARSRCSACSRTKSRRTSCQRAVCSCGGSTAPRPILAPASCPDPRRFRPGGSSRRATFSFRPTRRSSGRG